MCRTQMLQLLRLNRNMRTLTCRVRSTVLRARRRAVAQLVRSPEAECDQPCTVHCQFRTCCAIDQAARASGAMRTVATVLHSREHTELSAMGKDKDTVQMLIKEDSAGAARLAGEGIFEKNLHQNARLPGLRLRIDVSQNSLSSKKALLPRLEVLRL